MYVVACTGTSSLTCLTILVHWFPKPIPTYLYVVASTYAQPYPISCAYVCTSQATVSYGTAQFQLDICMLVAARGLSQGTHKFCENVQSIQ